MLIDSAHSTKWSIQHRLGCRLVKSISQDVYFMGIISFQQGGIHLFCSQKAFLMIYWDLFTKTFITFLAVTSVCGSLFSQITGKLAINWFIKLHYKHHGPSVFQNMDHNLIPEPLKNNFSFPHLSLSLSSSLPVPRPSGTPPPSTWSWLRSSGRGSTRRRRRRTRRWRKPSRNWRPSSTAGGTVRRAKIILMASL